MQDYSRFTDIFRPYLDPENSDTIYYEQGLVSNAPPEAVKAYEEYKKYEDELERLEKEIGLYL